MSNNNQGGGAESNPCNVSGLLDPVENPKLRIVKTVEGDNLVGGYFGYVRGYDAKTPKIHTGFDYELIENSSVYSVFIGNNITAEVWIGGVKEKCELYKLLEKKYEKALPQKKPCEFVFEFDSSICDKRNDEGYFVCKHRRDCFGVRLFLIDNKQKKVATYAHLCQVNISEAKWIETIDKYGNFFFKASNINVECKKEKRIVGKSGCTGNASGLTGEQQHLHFECGYGKVCPNEIVRTKFYIGEKGEKEEKEGGKKILKEVKEKKSGKIKYTGRIINVDDVFFAEEKVRNEVMQEWQKSQETYDKKKSNGEKWKDFMKDEKYAEKRKEWWSESFKFFRENYQVKEVGSDKPTY